MSEQNTNRRRRITMSIAAIFVAIVHMLSSGPVLATAFWLREATGRDEFYAVMLLYYPLHLLGPESILDRYIGWWCQLLDAMPPG